MNIQQSRRKATNIALDPDLVAAARAEGINLSRACAAGLAAELKKVREARWLDENREAIAEFKQGWR